MEHVGFSRKDSHVLLFIYYTKGKGERNTAESISIYEESEHLNALCAFEL